MRTLDREQAFKLWGKYWQAMNKEWFKIEVLQDYTDEDDCPSLRAWLRDDKQASLKSLSNDTRGWAKQLSQKTRARNFDAKNSHHRKTIYALH